MQMNTLIQYTMQGMLLCLTVSLPPVVIAGLVGLGVSFLQAITSMQDASITHAVKLVAVTVTVIVVAPLSCAAVLNFANQMVNSVLPQ
jgi:type III secretion protein S